MPKFRDGQEGLRDCLGNGSRLGCPVELFKIPNGVADARLSLEAVFLDPDYWNEIDTMADLNEAEKMFDGKRLEPAARNGGTFHSRLGPKVPPPSFSARDPMTPVAAND